jgi:hypothetical protein
MDTKPSNYVFRSGGLDTNTTRSVNKIDNIAKKAIDAGAVKLKLNQARIANRKHELDLRNVKLKNDHSKRRLFSNSLAHTANTHVKQIGQTPIHKRPTYISTNNGDNVGK